MAFWAFDITVNPEGASVLLALIVLLQNIYQSKQLHNVHKVVNSNFAEAKKARAAAESALKTSQDLCVHLQQQLDAALGVVAKPPVGVGPGAIPPQSKA